METTKTMVTAPITEQIFDALQRWINQRPGLDPREYGVERREGLAAYRQEVRQIGKDRKRAQKALDEARALEPNEQLLREAFTRAFSGRLEWQDAPGRLDYCTGQYWPTEYRKAAASVLEQYIAAWRQARNAAAPKTFTYATIEDVRAANRMIGHHWFEASTMRFFNTRIESGLIDGKRFITSERCEPDMPKKYTVRQADPDGTIDTIGEFQQYDTLAEARAAAKEGK